MRVEWSDGEPPVDEKTLVSGQLVVKTNYNNLNVGFWSAETHRWYLEGLMLGKECVIAWMNGSLLLE